MVRMKSNPTLAEVYRHFGEVDAAGTSPLYERVAVALSESDTALRVIEAVPARKRHPTVILAALHDLALAGRAPDLAAAYAAADGDAAAGAAVGTLLRMADSVVAIAGRRRTRADETGRCAVLYPAEQWPGCRLRVSESPRRYRHLAIAAPPATAPSAWQSSASRLCTPRPSAAAGRRAACWRGWQRPSAANTATALTRFSAINLCVMAISRPMA
jgi:hypothetical protein